MVSMELTIIVSADNPELVKELLESNGCSLAAGPIYHGDQIVARIESIEVKENT